MDVINDDAKAGFRRIEVLTGPGRRRRWSDAEKARIVAETLCAGATLGDLSAADMGLASAGARRPPDAH